MRKYIIFSKPYILIEDARGRHQPFFKEYESDKIPQLNMQSPALCCPFLKNKRFKTSTKRKERKGGFCEVCYQKYVNYEQHVKERSHREFALDPKNYKEIDEIIESFATASVENELYYPVSPLLRKSGSLPVSFDEKREIRAFKTTRTFDRMMFTEIGKSEGGKNNLYKAVHKVETFINDYLNK